MNDEQKKMVRPIRLEVLYENQYGRVLANKNYRIAIIECKPENIKEMFELHAKQIEVAQQCAIDSPNNIPVMEEFRQLYETKLFLIDDETTLIKDHGEWNGLESAAKSMLKSMMKRAMTHRFEDNE